MTSTYLTRFNKIATQGKNLTWQVDKKYIGFQYNDYS